MSNIADINQIPNLPQQFNYAYLLRNGPQKQIIQKKPAKSSQPETKHYLIKHTNQKNSNNLVLLKS